MTTNHPTTTIPTDTTDPNDVPRGDDLWEEYWAGVGNEDWQAARRLLELSWRVRGFYAAHLAVVLEPDDDDDNEDHEPPGRRREVVLDWESAAGRVDTGHIDTECIDTGQIDAAGFSSTEARLARLVAALTTGAPLDLASLAWMGSWSSQVWQVLCEWGTDGRLTTSERS